MEMHYCWVWWWLCCSSLVLHSQMKHQRNHMPVCMDNSFILLSFSLIFSNETTQTHAIKTTLNWGWIGDHISFLLCLFGDLNWIFEHEVVRFYHQNLLYRLLNSAKSIKLFKNEFSLKTTILVHFRNIWNVTFKGMIFPTVFFYKRTNETIRKAWENISK